MFTEGKKMGKIVQRVHYSVAGVMEDHAITVALCNHLGSVGTQKTRLFLLFSSMLIRSFWE